MKLHYVSIFSGAGGLDAGLENAGWTCRYASDLDKNAVSTLELNRGLRLPSGRRALVDTFIEQTDIRNLIAKDVAAKASFRKGDLSLLAAAHRALYQSSLTDPTVARADWLFALRETRRVIADALRASEYLEKMDSALMNDGAHNIVFRHLLAPPISQDQFKLLCPDWPKSSEKDSRPVASDAAVSAKKVLAARLDPGFGGWLIQKRRPTRRELRTLLLRVSPLIASQRLATAQRNRFAREQEHVVAGMLRAKGWISQPSRLIDTRAAVPAKHFMHKTRFATGTTTHQEVDIACGLRGTYVLAMECKVTNDETNSVKRINDVIKKAQVSCCRFYGHQVKVF